MERYSEAASALSWTYKSSSIPLICKLAITTPPPNGFHEKICFFHEVVKIKFSGPLKYLAST
jgi:hypothetical protein